MASAAARAKSIVDPEALVLISLFLREYEPRLWDVLDQWAKHGVRLLSVQRMKNLASAYPADTRGALSEFAALARETGRDARWKDRFFGSPGQLRPSRNKKLEMRLEFTDDAALMVRLRRGLGVNVRTDVLTYLLGQRGESITVRVMARALRYTEAGIRRAADDLAAARIIHATVDYQPATYSVDSNAWSRALELTQESLVWRSWHEIFSLTAELGDWARTSRGKKVSTYALDTLGWELVDRHRSAFLHNDIAQLVRRDRHSAKPFDELMARLGKWMSVHV
jgi:hypothetical protein